MLQMPEPRRGSLTGDDLRVAVICSRFNQVVTDRLLHGALEALSESGVREENVGTFSVPGAVEIPVLADRVARAGGVDAIVALGAVIRGETTHYDLVCHMAADGCLRVSLDTGIPIGFGLLTCENREQALARSGIGRANKGHEAALTAIEMANLLRLCGP